MAKKKKKKVGRPEPHLSLRKHLDERMTYIMRGSDSSGGGGGGSGARETRLLWSDSCSTCSVTLTEQRDSAVEKRKATN